MKVVPFFVAICEHGLPLSSVVTHAIGDVSVL
jgi:hypothetical protein